VKSQEGENPNGGEDRPVYFAYAMRFSSKFSMVLILSGSFRFFAFNEKIIYF
jgi:hypothetical protein